MSTTSQQKSAKCNYCGMNIGLEWVKIDDKNVLRYIGDKQKHYSDCKKIQAHEYGYTDYQQVVSRHQLEAPSSQQQQQGQETTSTPNPNVSLDQFVNELTVISRKIDGLSNSVAALKELMWQIPEVKKYITENAQSLGTQTAKDQYVSENKNNLPFCNIHKSTYVTHDGICIQCKEDLAKIPYDKLTEDQKRILKIKS